MIESLPAQYRWAADLELPDIPRASSVLVCGMGGSGISGDYARTVAAAAGADVRVHKDYGLPSWVARIRPLVVAVSYSGGTAETMSAVSEAERLGLPVVVVATGGRLGERSADDGLPGILVPGGLQPRAALGYLAGAVVRVVAAAGLIQNPEEDLHEAAGEVEQIVDPNGSGRDSARRIADRLLGRLVVMWASSGPAAVAAQRWAKQMHENAKSLAYWSLLPELDHNELVPWAEAEERGAGIVLIRDPAEPPELTRRFDLTRELIGGDRVVAGEVWAKGGSALARAASLSAIGDLVSVYLAEAKGVDPTSIAVLDELKNRL